MRVPQSLLSLLVVCFPLLSHGQERPARPNIVLILADDLGLDGVGCTGSDHHKTHNIDKLAAGGTRYMDKQVGSVVEELEKLGLREKTLVIFTADNGTALEYPSTIGGRKINGKKASLLEGGSRVPFIANWPGTTPAGKVCKDLVSFADPHATFAELAGVPIPAGLKFDGQSFAPQLRGQPGTPRAHAFVQLGPRWFLREPGYKMDQDGNLFDMSDAPFVEKPVPAESPDEAAKAARARLAAALAELNPAGGKVDAGGGKQKTKDGKGRKARGARGKTP